jgi:hypothetical protein
MEKDEAAREDGRCAARNVALEDVEKGQVTHPVSGRQVRPTDPVTGKFPSNLSPVVFTNVA